MADTSSVLPLSAMMISSATPGGDRGEDPGDRRLLVEGRDHHRNTWARCGH